MKQSLKRWFSAFACVAVLSSAFVMSGCVFDKESQKYTPPVETEKLDQDGYKNFSDLILVKKKYDNDVVKNFEEYNAVLSGLKSGQPINGYEGPEYEVLKKGLESVKNKGVEPKSVAADLEPVLTALNQLVPAQIELKKQRTIQGGDAVVKYLQALEQFNMAYDKFSTTVKTANKERIQQRAKDMRDNGYKNYSTAIEVMSSFTDLTENVLLTRSNPNRAQIEKDAADIMAKVNSIDSNAPEVAKFKTEAQKVVTSIQELLDHVGTPYESHYLQHMYRQYNIFIEAFSALPSKGIDGK